MSNNSIVNVCATAGGSATAVPSTISTNSTAAPSIEQPAPLPDPDANPREFNRFLIQFLDPQVTLPDLLLSHKIRGRDLAAWLRLPATQRALDELEFIARERTKRIAIDQRAAALDATVALLTTATSDESRRKAAATILRESKPDHPPQPHAASAPPPPQGEGGGEGRGRTRGAQPHHHPSTSQSSPTITTHDEPAQPTQPRITPTPAPIASSKLRALRASAVNLPLTAALTTTPPPPRAPSGHTSGASP